MAFGQFLRELRNIYRALSKGRKGALMRELVGALPPPNIDEGMEPDAPAPDTREQIAKALANLSPEDRVAVQLFVIDDLPAAEVARLVGWPSAKTVYNRVSRALAAMRADFSRRGIESADI